MKPRDKKEIILIPVKEKPNRVIPEFEETEEGELLASAPIWNNRKRSPLIRMSHE